MTQPAPVERDDDALIPLKEFARLFERNLRACQDRAKSGRWKNAERVGGQWWVRISTRAYHARLRALGEPVPVQEQKSAR